MSNPTVPQPFIWRRLHSIAGIWFSIYLALHLFTNSQAALFVGDYGKGFIHDVNWIHNLPYLPLIEIFILGVPIVLHMVAGVQILRTSESNSYGNSGKTPYLPQYPQNHAYTWQRITAWILLFAVIAHVVHMRFLDRPAEVVEGSHVHYIVRMSEDPGVFTVGDRLGVDVYDQTDLASLKDGTYPESPRESVAALQKEQREAYLDALTAKSLGKGELVAVAKDPGTAFLLMLRETFKSPTMVLIYSFFVIFACFHAFNGVWTFLITWGVTLSDRSQKAMQKFSAALIVLFSFLGLATAIGTYWINLRG